MSDVATTLQIVDRIRTAVETVRRLRGSTDPYVVGDLDRVDGLLDDDLRLLEAEVRRVREETHTCSRA